MGRFSQGCLLPSSTMLGIGHPSGSKNSLPLSARFDATGNKPPKSSGGRGGIIVVDGLVWHAVVISSVGRSFVPEDTYRKSVF